MRTTKLTKEKPSRGRADFDRMRGMSEADIERTSPPELANLPPDFWDSARMVPPVLKEPISIRVDEDVLAWFRKKGPRYQSRMNAVLRSYVEAKRGARRKSKAKRSRG